MTLRIVLALLLALLFSAPAAAKLKRFTSDGCSAFPDGTLAQQQLWLACCTAHDRAYWQGGSYRQRLEADLALKSCVEQVGEPQIALLMLAGVRVGGSPLWPTPFRWGYGWPYPRPYGELSGEELAQILAMEQERQERQERRQ
ncbi:hypothetical protein [Gallaecimonas sp. GXIMD4217]|uniref:hypothetical protein n=1 Tax=Gallaecimonas sp. GXIMD4217 TaxID=3131927 RepID=UPI00311B018B